MNQKLEELQTMQEKVDDAKLEKAQKKGKIEEKFKTIEEKFGIKTIEEMIELEKTLIEKEVKLSEKIEGKWTALQNSWEEACNE